MKGRYARAVEERGRLNAEAERYKRTSKERDDRIREACSSLELSTSLPQGGALTADQVMRWASPGTRLPLSAHVHIVQAPVLGAGQLRTRAPD